MLDNRGLVVEFSSGYEHLRLEPWGGDSIRVRACQGQMDDDLPGALIEPAPAGSTGARRDGLALVNGKLRAEVSPEGLVGFWRSDAGRELLSEQKAHFWWPGPRLFVPNGNGHYRIEQRFKAYDGEKLYGLGQHLHGQFDQKGLVMDLVQRNAEVSVPFMVSNRGYGFLWNSPAVGRVELAANGTRWVADSATQIDYWVTAGDPAEVLGHYADATGHAPELPSWASGFWQSKLRYRTQEELLAVAREYHRRGVPLAVIVSDFFHWHYLGDWSFDREEWPDPGAMVAELESMGTRLMVSVWPSLSPLSSNYQPMLERGLLVSSEGGPTLQATWPERGLRQWIGVAFYDPTNPRAREYIWEQVGKNYYDLGVRVFWLDACEPEMKPSFPANLRFAAGPGAAVANLYPREHARAFYEGMANRGETEILTLCRSAWAGSQRYGVAVWSGDIPSTFGSLRLQVRAGLNMALSGIPWWTTDIGGFFAGDPADATFRELIVRWFQYGAFCPLFRIHGDRMPNSTMGTEMTGGPNEIWSYGEEACGILQDYIFMRERMRPYLHAQAKETSERGVPIMRPLLVEFPEDPRAWEVDDQFMFGRDLLVAPVLQEGGRKREVYLPAGAQWTNVWTGVVMPSGTKVAVEAPLQQIPLFLRDSASVPVRGS
ncbi:MAG TPA: glycoside hydrolase family 31 protein [Acidimicrobiales bacterium]|nr:glycoside hydrolase family 31 protein [Acidimicrobiales bacterium]